MPDSPPHPFRETAIGLTTILFTLAGWTVVPILIFMFKDDVDPWTANGWRYGFAALLWLPLLLYKRLLGKWSKGLLLAALLPGLCNALAQIVFTYSLYRVEPAVMTFGLRFQIVAVTFGAAIFFPSERAIIKKPAFIAGLALLAAGVLATAAVGGIFRSQASIEGLVMSLAAGAGFGLYALGVRGFMKRFGSMESFAMISQITAAAMIALMLAFGQRSGATALEMLHPNPSRFALFLLSALIGIAAGHVLYYLAIRNLGVTVSSGVVQLQPFTVGAVSMLPFLSQLDAFAPLAEIKGLSNAQWLTGSLAVAGAIIMIVVQHRAKRHAATATLQPPATTPTTIQEPFDDIASFEQLPPDAIAAQAISEHQRDTEHTRPTQQATSQSP